MYVAGNNWLYNAMRLATLAVGGAAALQGAVTAEQLTTFCFYAEFMASALLSVCDQWGPISEVGCPPPHRAGPRWEKPWGRAASRPAGCRTLSALCWALTQARGLPPLTAGHWRLGACHGLPRRGACAANVGRYPSGGGAGSSSSRLGGSSGR